jgi:four helix bundle protein
VRGNCGAESIRQSGRLDYLENPRGMMLAVSLDMAGVTRFEDLDAWKLSVELRDLVYRLIESGRVLRDPEFRSQIRDSASSPPRNISEGWGRFNPKENAQYCRIAKASLDETKNHLLHGRTERYFDEENFNKAMKLARRARGATVGLIRYLESCKGRLPWDHPRPPRGIQKPEPLKPEPESPEPEPPEHEPGT